MLDNNTEKTTLGTSQDVENYILPQSNAGQYTYAKIYSLSSHLGMQY